MSTVSAIFLFGGFNMVFVNEEISDEDYVSFDLEALDARPISGNPKPRDWTIDRDRNIYLRLSRVGREENFGMKSWDFFWKNALIEVELTPVSSVGPRGGHIETVHQLSSLKMEPELRSHREAIIADLRAALEARMDAGIRSTATSYKHTLLL